MLYLPLFRNEHDHPCVIGYAIKQAHVERHTQQSSKQTFFMLPVV